MPEPKKKSKRDIKSRILQILKENRESFVSIDHSSVSLGKPLKSVSLHNGALLVLDSEKYLNSLFRQRSRSLRLVV